MNGLMTLSVQQWERLAKALLIVYLFVLAVLTFVPLSGINTPLNKIFILGIRLDVLLHVLAFVPLVPLWDLYKRRNHRYMGMVLGGVLVAAVAEGIHYVIPYRSYDFNDLLANVVGVLIGALIWKGLRQLYANLAGARA